MTASTDSAPQLRLQVSVTQQTYGPHDPYHGTPHAMVRRLFRFDLSRGQVEVDQTDYGHPGRFNPCHAQKVPSAYQPATPKLLAAAEALAALLD